MAKDEEQKAALYGPPGQADYKEGDIVKYLNPFNIQEQEILMGKVLYVRAPGEAVRGGVIHPTSFFVAPSNGDFPVAIYASDIVELVSRSEQTSEQQP